MSVIWEERLKMRTRRLRNMIDRRVPDVIIRNECYLVLEAGAHGKWRAVWAHFKHVAHVRWTCWAWEIEVLWHQIRHGVGKRQAEAALLEKDEERAYGARL